MSEKKQKSQSIKGLALLHFIFKESYWNGGGS